MYASQIFLLLEVRIQFSSGMLPQASAWRQSMLGHRCALCVCVCMCASTQSQARMCFTSFLNFFFCILYIFVNEEYLIFSKYPAVNMQFSQKKQRQYIEDLATQHWRGWIGILDSPHRRWLTPTQNSDTRARYRRSACAIWFGTPMHFHRPPIWNSSCSL